MTPELLFDRLSELNLKAVEWCHFPCHEPGKVEWQQVKLLDGLARENAITSSLAGFAPLLAASEHECQHMLDMVRTQMDVSRFIGSGRLRFHGMAERELGIGAKVPRERCLRNLRMVLELAEDNNIVLALENHMDFCTDDFRYFFDRIDSPFLAINLDTGNHLPLQEDVEAFAAEFSEKIVSCHLKAVAYVWRGFGAVLTSCNPRRSLVDLTAILDILNACEQDIVIHVEVVSGNSGDEELLINEHAGFLLDYLESVA